MHARALTVEQQFQSHKCASTERQSVPSIVFGKGSRVQDKGGVSDDGYGIFEDPILGAFASMHYDQHRQGALRASTGSYKAPAYPLFKSAPSASQGVAGVGVMLKKVRGDAEDGEESVRIVGLVDGGPAAKSGVVSPGDAVLSVDGWAVNAGNSGVTCKDVMLKLTGPPHTPVVLTLVRPESGETFRVFLTRGAANPSLGDGVRRKDRTSMMSAIPTQRLTDEGRGRESFSAGEDPVMSKSHANLYVDELFASTKALIRCVCFLRVVFDCAYSHLHSFATSPSRRAFSYLLYRSLNLPCLKIRSLDNEDAKVSPSAARVSWPDAVPNDIVKPARVSTGIADVGNWQTVTTAFPRSPLLKSPSNTLEMDESAWRAQEEEEDDNTDKNEDQEGEEEETHEDDEDEDSEEEESESFEEARAKVYEKRRMREAGPGDFFLSPAPPLLPSRQPDPGLLHSPISLSHSGESDGAFQSPRTFGGDSGPAYKGNIFLSPRASLPSDLSSGSLFTPNALTSVHKYKRQQSYFRNKSPISSLPPPEPVLQFVKHVKHVSPCVLVLFRSSAR